MSRLLRIALREYLSYVRTVGFWLSLCAMPVLMAGLITVPSMVDKAVPPPRLAIVDRSAERLGPRLAAALREDGGPPLILVAPPAAATAAGDAQAAGRALRLELGADPARLDAAVVLRGRGEGVSADLWTRNLADRDLEGRLHADLAQVLRRQALADAGVASALVARADRIDPAVTVFSPKAAAGRVSLRDRLPALAGFGMGFLLWSMVLTAAQILIGSVIEEKSNRILEVLLTSASVPEIMGGKILGAAGVTVSVLAVWGLLGSTIMGVAAPAIGADLVSVLLAKGLLAYFALYLAAGYLMYASVFVAIGAFCETPREAQTLLAPVMLTLSIPLVFMAQSIRHPDAPILGALSWIPPFTPFLMVARAASGPPGWQVAATLGLMAATTAVLVWVCGRAFRAGALGRVKISFSLSPNDKGRAGGRGLGSGPDRIRS